MYTLDLKPLNNSVQSEGTQSNRLNQELVLLKQYVLRVLEQNPGLYPKDRFIIAIDSHKKELICQLMIVCWHLPITLFPIAPELPERYKKRLIQLTGTKFLISELSRFIVNDIQTIDEQQLLEVQSKNLPEEDNGHSISYKNNPLKLIIATSGSTAKPKAVYLSKQNILAHFAAAKTSLSLDNQSIWLNVLPLNHVGGAMIIYRAMLAKARVVLFESFDVKIIWEVLQQEKITHLSLVPIMLEKLLECANGKTAPASLSMVLIGGSAISPALYHRAHQSGWPLCVSYGSSESCSFISIDTRYHPDFICGQSGYPIDTVEINLLGDRENGIISIKGPMMMAGYANQHYQLGRGLSKNGFISGDLGYWDDFHGLVVLGRADQQINSGGEKIEPQLLQEELRACPGIQEAAIIGVEDPSWGQRVALIYAGNGLEIEVQQWCQKHLKKQFKPSIVCKMAQLPRNPMGKLKTQDLIKILEKRKNFS